MEVPTFNELMWPTLQAIKKLGGSGSNSEIIEMIIRIMDIPENIHDEMHNDGPMTKLEYRGAWARTYLKKARAIENSERGIWAITFDGEKLKEFQMTEMVKEAREIYRMEKEEKNQTSEVVDNDFTFDVDWKSKLLSILKNKVTPAGFEKLSQRILRESGFTDVEITGRPDDKGIDGYGVLKINLLSFRVLFQCKRYKETVGPSYIRDFRGAMQGRAEKGLFITTGTFTSAAKKEAKRDGAPLIDLIDGSNLCDLLKILKIGIEIEQIEEVHIKEDWFEIKR